MAAPAAHAPHGAHPPHHEPRDHTAGAAGGPTTLAVPRRRPGCPPPAPPPPHHEPRDHPAGAAGGPTTLAVPVGRLACLACAQAVERALASQPGVRHVHLDTAHEVAHVAVEDSRVTVDELRGVAA